MSSASRHAAPAAPAPQHNCVLASLAASSLSRFEPLLEVVSLDCGAVLSLAGVNEEHAYFPTTAILSLQQGLDGNSGTEVAMVGRDGMSGACIVIGDGCSSRNTLVHCPGLAYRLPAQVLRTEFDSSADFREKLFRCFQVQMAQIAQNVPCYRLHSVDQQLCKRLLMLLDALPSMEVPVTQELLASALGVRREAITIACSRLMADGIIRPGRGRIHVLDPARLELHACECRSNLVREVARLLPAPESSFARN